MLLFFIIVILVLLLVAIVGRKMSMWDEEEVTTTTTVSDPDVVGNLRRRTEGVQFFVIDPSDQQKIWINDTDDMYQDADGKVWKLV